MYRMLCYSDILAGVRCRTSQSRTLHKECSQNAEASACTGSQTDMQVWQGKVSGCWVTFWGPRGAATARLVCTPAAGREGGQAACSSPTVADMLPLPSCASMQDQYQHDGMNIIK